MFPPECVCSSVYSVVWIAAAISAEWLLDDWTVTIRVEPFFVGSENFPRVSVSEALLSPRSRSSGMPALRVPGHTIHSRWSTPTSSSWRPAKIRGKPFFSQALCLTLFWRPPPPHAHTRSNCKKNYSQTKPRSHKLFSTPRSSILEHS